MEWLRSDGYLITDERERVDLARVHRWLSAESYWAAGRSLELVSASIQGSITLGCFNPEGLQVGITRLVTDGATFGLLTDVFVDEDLRGLGLGKFLIEVAMNLPEAQHLKRVLLATNDAHELYRRFGFTELSNSERWMETTLTSSRTDSID
jgi:N-acetylglutamate synthase-like GNAT family acetyltransferase